MTKKSKIEEVVLVVELGANDIALMPQGKKNDIKGRSEQVR